MVWHNFYTDTETPHTKYIPCKRFLVSQDVRNNWRKFIKELQSKPHSVICVRCRKRREVWDALRALQADPRCGKLPLHSFLNLPMQRVTRLPLLVDQLCSCLGDQHPDYQLARNALKQLQWVSVT